MGVDNSDLDGDESADDIIQHDALPDSSASPTPPAPSVQPATSPVTTKAMNTAAATMESLAQSARTITATSAPQLGETPAPPIALSSPHPTQPPAEAQLISGGAGVIVSEGQSAGVDSESDAPMHPEGKVKSKRKTATKRAKIDVVVGDTDPAPRRASTRTNNLKRKKMDADSEVPDTQPAKKKKTAVKDRWVYVTDKP